MKHHKNTLLLIALASLSSLSACTPYSESFDCPPGRGVGCKSLSTINHMVEEGYLPGKLPLEENPVEQELVKQAPEQEAEETTAPGSFDLPLIEVNNSQQPISLLNQRHAHNKVIPNPTTHLKVWVAGYEDANKAYHAPSYVYIALKE